jgi:hypothetical protein
MQERSEDGLPWWNLLVYSCLEVYGLPCWIQLLFDLYCNDMLGGVFVGH